MDSSDQSVSSDTTPSSSPVKSVIDASSPLKSDCSSPLRSLASSPIVDLASPASPASSSSGSSSPELPKDPNEPLLKRKKYEFYQPLVCISEAY